MAYIVTLKIRCEMADHHTKEDTEEFTRYWMKEMDLKFLEEVGITAHTSVDIWDESKFAEVQDCYIDPDEANRCRIEQEALDAHEDAYGGTWTQEVECRKCGDKMNWRDYGASEEEFCSFVDHDICFGCRKEDD